MKTMSLRILTLALLAACTSGTSQPTPPTTEIVPPPGTFVPVEGKALAYPVRVAIAADGVIYASDYVGGSVLGLRDGVPVLALTGLDRPLGVAVSGELLYVGSEGRGTVEAYDLATRTGLRSAGGFAKPNDIAVAPDGLIHVVDSKAGVVRVLDADLQVVRTIGARGTGDGQLLEPVSVAVDATRVAVADRGLQRVAIFDRSGAFVKNLGGEMTPARVRGRFTTISSVAFSGDDLLVLDTAHSMVQVLDREGACRGLFGHAGECDSCVALALDIAVDADGRVLATDPEHRRVVTLSTEMR